MSNKQDLSITVKRAPVVNNLEKYANNVLSDSNVGSSIEVPCKNIITTKECIPTVAQSSEKTGNESGNCKNSKLKGSTHFCPKQDNDVRKFFLLWKNFVKFKKDRTEQLKKQTEIKEKLDCFLKCIKQYQNQKINNETNNSTQIQRITKPNNNYEHRFKAQQDIIQIQKEKLIQQEKIIQQLKLNKIEEAIDDSMEEAKLNIRETLTKCSIKVKCKATMLTNIEDSLSKFYIQSCKAPKILQQMEKRALEREQKRQTILERKRKIDCAKKQAIEREIENKRIKDEEERKRSLLEIKERRKIELEIQKQKQIKKQLYLEKCAKADRFYNRKLKKFAFSGFLKLILIKYNNIYKSEEFYENYLKHKCINGWKNFLEQVEAIKINKAINLLNITLKKRMLNLWYKAYTTRIQNIQVAEDLYELKLQSKILKQWHRIVCIQYVLTTQNFQKAQRHYDSRILLHYFYQWKSLRAINQLEKAKEEKKRRWREKVWEILPDYQPEIID